MKKAKILFVTALTLGVMTGCTAKFNPYGTAILARKDGDVRAVVMETLDQDYYDSTELQNLVNKDVADYNASKGTEQIRIEKYEISDQTVNLTMEYTTGEDYASFNNVAFYTGNIVGAYNAGYDFQATFQKVEKGTVADAQVSREEVLNSYNYYTVILEESMDVQVEGTIIYASSNVQITGKNSCRVLTAGTGYAPQETEAETLEDGAVLLVPSTGTGEATKTQAKKDLAYIMYE